MNCLKGRMYRTNEIWTFMVLIISLQTGTCDSCKPGYYPETFGCFKCLGNCATCRSTTRSSCDTCKLGYYDQGCLSECSHACVNKQCDKNDGKCTCIEGYNIFYYDSSYGRRYICCPENCFKCTSSSECTSCKVGYFGRKCDQPCRNCRDKTCSIHGWCTYGCKDGHYRDKFDCEACPDNCETCTSSSSCTLCNAGYFGRTCDKTCYYCNDTCVLDHGLCSNGCKDGNHNVCYHCLDGFWGPYCGHTCNDTCIRCDKSTGECTECTDNAFGSYCEIKCSRNCVQRPDRTSSCLQPNGTCTDGCQQGFTGHDCSDELSLTTHPQVTISVGSTVGAIAFIVVAVLLVFLLRRRRIRHPDSKVNRQEPTGNQGHTAMNEVLNPAYGGTNSDNNPTTVSRHQNNDSAEAMDSSDNVYAVVHKKSHQKPVQLNKTHGHQGKEIEADNVYDESSGRQCSVMQAGNKMSQAEGDTYSHISHASRARQLHHDDEGAYDHVARHDLQKDGDGDETYAFAGVHNNYVQNTSHCSKDEYSTVRHVK